jgi:hypothetical protein
MFDAYKDRIPGDAQAAIEKEIRTAQQEYQVKQRGIIAGAFQDNLASLEATGEPVTPLSNDQITAAYGPERGARMVQQLKTATATYGAVQRTALTSPTEDQAALDGMAPHGLGFADQAHAQGVLQKVISQKWATISKDPAGYVLENAPGIKPMFDGAKDASSLKTYAGALDDAYDKLGLPSYARPLLPKDVAAGQVAKILQASPEARSCAAHHGRPRRREAAGAIRACGRATECRRSDLTRRGDRQGEAVARRSADWRSEADR